MKLPRASVLVVDDDPQVLDLLTTLLGWDGYEVVGVGDGDAALEAVASRRFDLALVDLLLPGISGHETVSALKTHDPELVVMCISGQGTLEAAMEGLRRGAWQYVEKPFDNDQLLLLVGRALEHRELTGAVALYEASEALLSSLSTAELRGRVLDMGCRVLRSCAAVLLFDREDEAGWESHATGDQPDGASALARRIAGELSGRAPTTGPIPREEGGPFAWYAAYALVVRDRSLGVLVALRAHGAPAFTGIEQRSGAIFAAQAALALDNARIYATLEALSVIDELTGLHSRRYLFDTIRRGGGLGHEGGTSFLMVDVDHFKAVNDTWGHATGDRVLRRVAELVLAATRESDIVARIGGEEFAVLLPGTDEEVATQVAERIRASVARSTTQPQVTVSVGVATVSTSIGDDAEDQLERTIELMEHADLALYRAKGAGRNQVCVWRARHRRETVSP